MRSTLNTFTAAGARRSALLIATSFTLVLGGCASAPTSKVAQTTKVEFYPTCYEPVEHLRSTNSDVTKSVATGAVVGGLLGGVTGALAGDKEKMGRNAAIGLAGGALAGGAVGYYTEKQKQITDDKQRIGSYASDLDGSTQSLDRNIAYAKASQTCYQAEFDRLISARKAKTINDAEGRRRLAEIVSGLRESNQLIVAANGKATQDVDSYSQAYEKDLQQVGVQRQDVVTVATAESTSVKPTKTKVKVKKPANVPTEAVSTEKSLQKAQTKQVEAKQVAANGQSLMAKVCSSPDMGDWAPDSCKA
ncbi:type VI secretion system-associated lipoprotein TagQ [Pseudomonas sp. TE3610]